MTADWQPINTAPTDGTWFLICNARDGFNSYEVGRYEPMLWPKYVEAGDGLYRKEMQHIHEWRGLNNMHRATHWMPLPEPPPACESNA